MAYRFIKIPIPALVVLSILLAWVPANAQRYQQWGALEPGSYNIGYRVVLRTDYSRTFGAHANHHERSNADEHSRPLQINIWYPALKSDSTGRMMYAEYMDWIGMIGKRHQLTDDARDAGKSEFYRYFTAQGIREEKLDQLMKMTTAAEKNAYPEKGPFPLILFAPGIGESPIMHTILCEYLASHGYIVASLPSMGWISREMEFTGACVETQTRDMEEALTILWENPNVDMHRIGIIGFSLGSCSALLVSMRNIDIDAAVSLDGSIGFRDRLALVKGSPFYTPAKVRIPFLHINVKGNRRNDLSILDSMNHSVRYIVGIKGITHVNFTSLGMIAGIVPGFWKSIEPNARLAYETICRYTLDFLNGYVKEEKKALEHIRSSTRPYITPPGFVSVDIEEPVTVPAR